MGSEKYDYRKKYDYQKEWEEYRRRRNWHFGIFFSAIVFFPLGMFYFKMSGLDENNPLLQFILYAV